MSHKAYFAAMRPGIEAHMQRVIEMARQPGDDSLYDMLAYHMGWPEMAPEVTGKRIRPVLVTLTCAAAGGDWQTAIPAAAAVELLHNFSLIHDDIEDNSDLRRGRPTLWKLHGIPLALNAGDSLFTLARMALAELNLPAERVVRAYAIFDETCLQLTQGQHLDISYERRNILPIEAYWPVVTGKTAVLIGACAQLGALAAGADEETRQAYASFGRNLGLAFQVLDDMLGIWGDAVLTGKSAASDLVSGKKSLPVLYGLAQNGTFAERWLQGPLRIEEVPAIAEILKAEGALDYARQAAADLTSMALEALDRAKPQGEPGQALRSLAMELLQRNV